MQEGRGSPTTKKQPICCREVRMICNDLEYVQIKNFKAVETERSNRGISKNYH